MVYALQGIIVMDLLKLLVDLGNFNHLKWLKTVHFVRHVLMATTVELVKII
jgi:hypothetical protein